MVLFLWNPPRFALMDETQILYSQNAEDYELGNAIGTINLYFIIYIFFEFLILMIELIGFGSSAIVYIATYVPLGSLVAIKMIELDRFERNQIDELRKEILVMSLCKHENLLQVSG